MLRWLILLCCLLSASAVAAPAQLRVQGSNTIGATLAPALVKALLQAQGATAIVQASTGIANESVITARGPQDQQIRIEIAAHGSSTGFTALAQGKADIAAASRSISSQEALQLRALGDLRSAASEQVIGLDGVALITHPDNPLPQLTIAQLAQVFSGQIQNWEQLGVPGGKIHLYARDDRSGTFATFKALVLDAQRQTLSAAAERLESADELAMKVAADRQAIGFSGLASVHTAKVLAVADGEGPAMLPTRALVASEDYPLSRRLYFYLPTRPTPYAQALAEFAQSAAGQAIVADQGYVAQQIKAVPMLALPGQPPAYRTLASKAQRLTVNFRFEQGSANLDSKALRDVQRVASYLRGAGKLHNSVVLVGFGDPKDTPGRAALLSRLRAMAVRRELVRCGVEVLEVSGLGEELPVADNDQQQGRIRNRRVEVWVY